MLQPLLKTMKAPSLVLASLLLATACATAPARPPVQIGTSQPRVDPSEDPAELGEEDLGELEAGVGEDGSASGAENVVTTPDFMVGKDVKRAAVLLPFSHSNSRVRREAEAMLAGIELALFEFAGDDFLIVPKDTGGKQSMAEARADEAIAEDADVVIGPLFGANVRVVSEVMNEANVPVIAFSNDRAAAGGGAYLASVLPEEEVRRVVQYAASKGVTTFAFLGPRSDYGRQVDAAMRFEVSQTGGTFIASEFYESSGSAVEEAKRIAALIEQASNRYPGRVAVMIPERGVKLLSVAPLLPYYGVDLRKVKLLGTSLWDDPSIWREPTLQNGLFASTDPELAESFETSYKRIYGTSPTALAASAYDATAVSIILAGENNLRYNGVTDPDGFMGVNGLFRFRLDGTAERSLSVMEILAEGAQRVERGLSEFPPGGS